MATPLETNTTELEGLLQNVYNLPNRDSSGSSEPDLVIEVVLPKGYIFSNDNKSNMTFSIKSGSAANTFTKLKNREEVTVFVEHEYWYSDNKFTGVFYPDVVSALDRYDGAQSVSLDFMVSACPGFGYIMSQLSIIVLTNETIDSVFME